jgi:hypothetical protein
VQVIDPTVPGLDLAEQQRATVAEAGGVAAELVSGVGLRHRRRASRHEVSHQQLATVGAAEPRRVEAEVPRQRLVQHQQLRVGHLSCPPGQREFGELTSEPVVESEGRRWCDTHDPEHRRDRRPVSVEDRHR